MKEEVYIENLEELQKECLEFIKEKIDLDKSSFVWMDGFLELPSLKKSIKPFEENIFGTVLNVALNKECDIHIDDGSSGWRYSFNIPIINCDDTFVYFYECEGESTKKEDTKTFGAYQKFEQNECRLIETFETNKPYILDTRVPHNFKTFNNKPRVMLLIRLKNTFGE